MQSVLDGPDGWSNGSRSGCGLEVAMLAFPEHKPRQRGSIGQANASSSFSVDIVLEVVAMALPYIRQ